MPSQDKRLQPFFMTLLISNSENFILPDMDDSETSAASSSVIKVHQYKAKLLF